MSRRAHQKTPPWLVGSIAGAVIFLGIAGGYFLQKDQTYRAIESLNPAEYLENANSLRGNVYKIEGTIINSLGWKPEQGRLFALMIQENGKNYPLPILVPANLRQINIQKNQSYISKVSVNDDGILVVQEIHKS